MAHDKNLDPHFSSLSLREKAGAAMVVGLSGTKLTANEEDFLLKENIGGVILFKRNFESPQQLHNLSQALRALAKQKPDRQPFFISVDQEGGRVARFRAPFTEWPPMKKVGEKGSAKTAFDVALAMGEELASVGINMNFAPSLDILTNPANQVIGDRAFGITAETVAQMGSACTRGFLKSGLIPVGKHFPGHGNTLLDSHEDLPVEQRTFAELDSRELEPFRKAFQAKLPVVMMSHILFPNVDPNWPASLSRIFQKEILVNRLHWRGLIISDDLDMKALRKNWTVGEIALQALRAGTNILLYCNEPDSPRLALDAIENAVMGNSSVAKDELMSAIDTNLQRISDLKKHFHLGSDQDPTIQTWGEAELIIGQTEHKKMAATL